MNRNYGYLFIGIEEQDDKVTGMKAIPVRPITGLLEGQLEVAENHIKSLFKYIQPTQFVISFLIKLMISGI